MTEFEIESVRYTLSPKKAWGKYGEVLERYANGKIVDDSGFKGFKIFIKIKTVSQLQLLAKKIGYDLILCNENNNRIVIYDDYME